MHGSGGNNKNTKDSKPEVKAISISMGKHRLKITGWCVFCQEPIELSKIEKALKKSGFKIT